MISFPVIRVITKILIPYILLFALYVQFHGDFGPGGGFQAGVIFASALILYGLVFGLPAAHKVAPPKVIEKLIACGLLLFAGTGVATMLLARKHEDGSIEGNFLDYDLLEHDLFPGFLPEGQHLGIFLVELGVGITVTAVMTIIFYAFAGRERVSVIVDQVLGLYNYWVVIVLMMTGFYIVIARGNLIKTIIGLNIFQTSVFLLYITMGKVEGGTAPIIVEHAAGEHGDESLSSAAHVTETIYSNPLPSVLMLTAIVVGVATTALALALIVRIREDYGTIEEDEILELDRAS